MTIFLSLTCRGGLYTLVFLKAYHTSYMVSAFGVAFALMKLDHNCMYLVRIDVLFDCCRLRVVLWTPSLSGNGMQMDVADRLLSTLLHGTCYFIANEAY